MATENKKEFNDKFQSFVRSAKKAGKKAANKTMELADLASLNLKLQRINVKLSEKFEELGKLSYKKLSGVGEINEAPTAESDNAVDMIAAIVDEIDKLYTSQSRIKAEIKAKKAQSKPQEKSEEEEKVYETEIIND